MDFFPIRPARSRPTPVRVPLNRQERVDLYARRAGANHAIFSEADNFELPDLPNLGWQGEPRNANGSDKVPALTIDADEEPETLAPGWLAVELAEWREREQRRAQPHREAAAA